MPSPNFSTSKTSKEAMGKDGDKMNDSKIANAKTAQHSTRIIQARNRQNIADRAPSERGKHDTKLHKPDGTK